MKIRLPGESLIVTEHGIDLNKASPSIFGQQSEHLGLPDCITPTPMPTGLQIMLGSVEPCLSFVSQKINGPSHLVTHEEQFLGPSVTQSLGAKPMHSVN
jgi:hypothetical protein